MREWQSLDSRRPGDRGSDHGGRVPRTWKTGAVTCRISTGRGTQEADRSGLSGCVSWSLSDMSPACPERTVSAHPAPRLVQKPRPQARASFPHWLKSRWDDWGGASGHGVCFGLLPCVILCLRPSSVRLPTYPSAPWPVCPLFSPRCVGMSHADEQQCPDAEWPRRGLRVAPHLERHREDLELGQAVPWGCGSSLCCLLRRQTRSGGHATPARTGTLQAATPSCPTRKYKGCFLGLKTPTRKAGRGSRERGPHTPRGYKS